MIVTTTHTIEGRRITRYHGIVSGETVVGTNIFRDTGPVSQAILPLPASGIAEDLLHGGLADIYDCFAGKVISRDPAHLAPPSHPDPGRSPPA